MASKSLAFLCALVFSLGARASAETLTFDGLTGDATAVPNGYGGLNFTNFFSITSGFAAANFGADNGYTNGTASQPVSIYNGFGSPASITSADGSLFTASSVDLTGAWNNGLQVTVSGYAQGVLLDAAGYTVNETGPTLETLNFAGIDTLLFSAAGGTPATSTISGGNQFVLDNLTVSTAAGTPTSVTPEPNTLLLFGTGLAGLAGLARRRLRA